MQKERGMKGSDSMARGRLTEIEEEFADFVDTHDTSEMIDSGEFVEVEDIKINISPKKATITMKIYPALLERIKRIAETQKIPYQSLIGQWLAERTYFEEHKSER